jgi:hypothetical protein
VRAVDDGTRIDVRAASRYGRTDFGSNPTRLPGLLDDVDARLTASAEEQRERPTPRPPAPPTARR